MEIHVESKRSVDGAGNFICTENNNLFLLAIDTGDKYPFLLLSLQNFAIIQNYDELPTREELEEDIGEPVKEIYNQDHASITLL
ncbi:hypothetical protein JCM19046_3643 [Bacillus sp. JCM 19046]|uniref:Uncharacterized protein n=1 Tax=Shouchella xiaoxiensis TaxID=766895 RepID=A0ABS2SPK4_9BACI|nr:hypothetical protein [Shouchella xiaoxiensis]MBM7837458.1 hypothetical protein [Shouchella xiaoxiensis]GAF15478.1 hypothetical protein JCM19045_4848 [Bacillus sp. JCM 19045]GAF19018.1 hypothetical protein JCM19046_3643 [Bacillus sp. JCM 19046]